MKSFTGMLNLRKFRISDHRVSGRFGIVIISAILFLVNLGGCTLQAKAPPAVAIKLIAQGFTSPVALVDPEDGSRRLFVVDQTGLIWIIFEGGRLAHPFLDLGAQLVELNSFYDERGLLGLALHPHFSENGRLYVSYSAPLQAGSSPTERDHTTYISEFKVSSGDPNLADPTSERVLIAMDKPGYNYEAGHLAFGPDGYLYIATGDSVRDPASAAGEFAQDTSSLLGKILRIDVDNGTDSGRGYSIPSDNPFVNGGGRPEIYAYGFRNPYRFSFDVTGSTGSPHLFVADVGQASMEEVNLVTAGRNYGWPIREGTLCFNSQNWAQPLQSCQTKGLVDPIIAYAHQGDFSAVIGGIVYRGQKLPELEGGYIFGDWGRGNGHLFISYPPVFGSRLWDFAEIQIDYPSGQAGLGQLLGIGQDGNGELYLLTKDPGTGPTGKSGKIYAVLPP